MDNQVHSTGLETKQEVGMRQRTKIFSHRGSSAKFHWQVYRWRDLLGIIIETFVETIVEFLGGAR